MPAFRSTHDLEKSLWAAGLGWLVPMMGAMTAMNLTIGPDRIDKLSRVYTRTQVALTGSRWRAEVHPDVDPKGVYVFAQNHTNHFDHVTLYAATPHFKQGLELEAHFRYPVYGWFMKARGTIPVRPGSKGQTPEIMAHMRAEIARGHSILAFPEGTRTTDGRVGKFRTGVFFIARDLGIPVVPVAVTGLSAVYVAGKRADQMKVRNPAAKSLSGFTLVSLDAPNAFPAGRHAVTGYGVGAVLDRIAKIATVEKALNNQVEVYATDFRFDNKPVTRYEILTRRPHTHRYAHKMLVYVDAATKLPVRWEAYDAPRPGTTTGDLLEAHSYSDLRLNVGVGDAAFE